MHIAALGVVPMEPSKQLWIILGGAPLLVLALIAGYVVLGDSLEAPRGYITNEGLTFDSRYLPEAIPLESILITEVRLVDPRIDTEYRVTRKVNGTAISDYRVGWFRLSNGEKAFVSLDSRSQALYVPTNSGFSLLIGGSSGMDLLSDLKKHGHEA